MGFILYVEHTLKYMVQSSITCFHNQSTCNFSCAMSLYNNRFVEQLTLYSFYVSLRPKFNDSEKR